MPAKSALVPEKYVPPFITETNEILKEDCTVCATLMAVASWTLGEVVTDDDWRPMNAKELKRLRERLRNRLPADKQHGPTTIADAREFIEEEWPFLPPVPFFDSVAEQRTFGQVFDALQTGFVGVAIGNPSHAPAGSRLRHFTSNDVGHAIFLERARLQNGKRQIFVMDPMGHDEGAKVYRGEFVPASHVRAFTDVDDAQGHVKVSMFKRGGASPEARARLRLQQRIKALKDDVADVAELRSRLHDVRAALSDAEASNTQKDALIATLQEQLAAVPG